MATIPSEDTPKTDALDPTLEAAEAKKKLWRELKSQRDACKAYRRKLVSTWQTNVDYRRGKPFASQSDEDRIAVPIDWQMTKVKHALLFSQIPAIRVSHPPQTSDPQALPWVHNYEQKVNDTLIQAGIETAMDEVLPDCINAAGIGIVIVSHETITEDVTVPAIDPQFIPPEFLAQGVMDEMGTPIPTRVVPRVVDHRYMISRVSPADFLWPETFTGSDFDQSPWLGRSGRITWSEAVVRFGLEEKDKQKVLGEDRTVMDKLTNEANDKEKIGPDVVSFDEIFYREFQFDPASKSFNTIRHLVFVNGKEDPVIDEAWKGQQPGQNGKVLGVTKYPIRVLTLAYITDEAIPPSDSSIARTQVNELNKSRTQMMLQRDRSMPIRWFDVNRVDPTIQQSLMRGIWQGMIPVQGQGDRIIGEVSRASHPPENFKFDQIIKNDLSETWQTGQPESGAGVETKGEASAIQSSMNTRIGRERAKVGKFFCSIAEVIGGMVCLFEDPASFGQGFNPEISTALSYSILADSTLLLDAQQRIKRYIDFLNFAGKSGMVNVPEVLKEIATLSGLDPNAVIKKPDPKTPQEPNISLRLTGTEDMLNPLTLAFLMKSGQAPDQKLIEQAKQLIQTAVTPPPNAMMPPPMPPQMGPDGQPVPQEGAPQGQPGGGVPVPIPVAPPLPVDVPQAGGPVGPGEGNPDWQAFPRINQRVIER